MNTSITTTTRTWSWYAPAVRLHHRHTCLAAVEADAACFIESTQHSFPPSHDAKFLLSYSKYCCINKSCCVVAWWQMQPAIKSRNQKPALYRHTPNSAKRIKSIIRVRKTSKMLLSSFVHLKVQNPEAKVHCFRVYCPCFVLFKVQKYKTVQN